MATKKDLVEAYSFSRRRLITAFVSGAPGGREVEPTRPGRTLIGGIALAVLLVAGALILGIIKSPDNVDWGNEMLVSEKETGADYVNLVPPDGGDPVLRPVINITSAMLLLGEDVTSTQASQSEIEDQDRGEPIGILQAPATPPRTDKLVQSGWTACVGTVGGAPSGIQATVTPDPQVTQTPDTSFAVRTADGRLFLVAESPQGWTRPSTRAYAYPVDERDAERIFPSVARIPLEDVVTVPDSWVTLFPKGGTLGLVSFGLAPRDIGTRSDLAGGGSTIPNNAKVGDVLEDGDTDYLLLADSTLLLDDFSRAVYFGAFPDGAAPPQRSIPGPPPSTTGDVGLLPAASWPTRVTLEPPSGGLCAELDAVPGQDPGVKLARADVGSDAAPDDVPLAEIRRAVESGSGAFVRSGTWDQDGEHTLALVDDRGLAYRVDDDTAAANLGYSGVSEEVVPSAWLQLFDKGVTLSVDAARCPPTSSKSAKTCADQ